jgi:hypothetical protein
MLVGKGCTKLGKNISGMFLLTGLEEIFLRNFFSVLYIKTCQPLAGFRLVREAH